MRDGKCAGWRAECAVSLDFLFGDAFEFEISWLFALHPWTLFGRAKRADSENAGLGPGSRRKWPTAISAPVWCFAPWSFV